jgi:hypothetical protein
MRAPRSAEWWAAVIAWAAMTGLSYGVVVLVERELFGFYDDPAVAVGIASAVAYTCGRWIERGSS